MENHTVILVANDAPTQRLLTSEPLTKEGDTVIQAKDGIDRSHDGLGLGLLIARIAIGRHGKNLKLKTREGGRFAATQILPVRTGARSNRRADLALRCLCDQSSLPLETEVEHMPDSTSHPIEIRHSACPHDCPSTCALEIERLDESTIGRVRGATGNAYTAGVICAKVARYAERAHHPDRLLKPLLRTGPKGSKQFKEIDWDEALDRVAEKFLAIEATSGPEAIWPYFYAGTMGMVMRDGINRLRHTKRYSGQYSTVCTTLAFTGFIAGKWRNPTLW